MKRLSTLACVVAIVCAAATATLNGADDMNTQTARLYQLQADFHRAASVHDWVNGDTQAVIDARILEMLDLWTPDGVLHLSVGGSFDGFYDYRGDVFTPADVEDVGRCPTLSGAVNTTRGTLCTFFRYVAGSFQLPNRIVSLAPAYKTRFDIQGETAGVYFECHYFNVAPAAAPVVPWPPRAGLPAWTPTGSQVVANGTAVKRHGDWRFFYLDGLLSTDAYLDAPLLADASVPHNHRLSGH